MKFIGCIKKGYTWKDIYNDLMKEYPEPIKKPEKEEKSIKELKKCDNTLYIE